MRNAAVIGGGMAGLAAAKVLSQFFDTVTIYDSGDVRQSAHQHVLLKSGQLILEKIFPGMRQKLVNAGCLEVDWAKDTLWENFNGAFPRYSSTVKTLSMSRGLLQKIMQEELLSVSNVHFIKKKVDKKEDVEASLVVISGGQNFSLNNFLGSNCFESQSAFINLTYRSYVFNQSDLDLENFKQYYYQIDPPNSFIGGVICPIEEGKAMVTIIEKENAFSSCDTFEDFLTKAQQIPGGRFYKIIKKAKPLSAMAVFRKLTTHKKMLDEKNVPKGIIVLGDALHSLNPVFGQGMTLSLIQVQLLQKMLLNEEFDEENFHKKCSKLSSIPYLLSRIGSEEKGIEKGILRFYLKICQNSKLFHHHFLKILHSLGSPRRLT